MKEPPMNHSKYFFFKKSKELTKKNKKETETRKPAFQKFSLDKMIAWERKGI